MKNFKKFIETAEAEKFDWELKRKNNEKFCIRLWHSNWHCHCDAFDSLEMASAYAIKDMYDRLEYEKNPPWEDEE